MIVLALDSSSSPSGVAVTDNGLLLAETIFSSNRTLSKRLLPAIMQVLEHAGLALDNIDLFACATGPGSFTGVRTGIATIQGLALARNKPCAGFSTLEMLACNIPFAKHPVCPMLDARKDEVYTGLYSCSPSPVRLMDNCVLPPAEMLARLSGPVIFVGDGAVRYRQLIVDKLGENAHFATAAQNVPRPSNGAILAEISLSEQGPLLPEQLLPTYLRLSEAELSKKQKV